jgi:hypothetical protein
VFQCFIRIEKIDRKAINELLIEGKKQQQQQQQQQRTSPIVDDTMNSNGAFVGDCLKNINDLSDIDDVRDRTFFLVCLLWPCIIQSHVPSFVHMYKEKEMIIIEHTDERRETTTSRNSNSNSNNNNSRTGANTRSITKYQA